MPDLPWMGSVPGNPRDRSAGGDDLAHHERLHRPVSKCPLVEGNRVTLLTSASEMIAALMDAIAAARDHVHLEYYTLEDVVIDGRSLFDVIEAKAREGVEVALIWDAIGSAGTPDQSFERLRQAGVQVLEYHSVNPLRRTFNFSVNDRDHRKLTVIDNRVGFLGGVNLSKVYETPEATGRGSSPDDAYWIDNAIRIEGPAVAEIQKLFFHVWNREDEDKRRLRTAQAAEPCGDQTLRIDGSAPRERRPLYNMSIKAAIRGAQRHIVLATGYFVPTVREWRLLAAAARRGVQVDLLLAGYSDVPSATRAGRVLYGTLMRAGVRIHEVHRGMLHAKVATVDGAWTSIGSSNFDRRSVYFNNEIDAIVLGRETAERVEAMLRGEIARAVPVDRHRWRTRPVRERLYELLTWFWRPLL